MDVWVGVEKGGEVTVADQVWVYLRWTDLTVVGTKRKTDRHPLSPWFRPSVLPQHRFTPRNPGPKNPRLRPRQKLKNDSYLTNNNMCKV